MKLTAQEDLVIERACRIMERQFASTQGQKLDDPMVAKRYVALKLGRYRREVFLAIWLTAQLRVIAAEEVSRGSIQETTVYGREIVRSALEHNAARVIFAHNHPGGCLEFSMADRELTEVLRRTLALIDVKVVDHLLVGNGVASLHEVEAREDLVRQEEEHRPHEEAREQRRAKREAKAARH